MNGAELLEKIPEDPKDLERWIIDNGQHTYIIKDGDDGTCTKCGSNVQMGNCKHNEIIYCHHCNSEAQVKEKRYKRKKLTEYGRILWFSKKGKSIYAKLALFEINFEAETGMPEVKINVTDIYKFSEKEILRFKYECKWNSGWKYDWYPMKNITIPGLATSGFGQGNRYNREVIYDKNFDIFKNSDLKYAAVKDFYKKYELYFSALINYIRDSLKYSSLELLRKAGFEKLVLNRVHEQYGVSSIYWRGNDLRKILRLDNMDEVRKLRGCEMKELLDYQVLKKAGYICKSAKEANEVAWMWGYYKEEMKENIDLLSKTVPFIKANKYLIKQKRKLGGHNLARTYLDYLKECKKLNMNLTDKNILFPKKLQEAHEKTSAQIKAIADEVKNTKIREKAERLASMNWQDSGLIIRVATTAEEIIREGKNQHHCVGSYVDKVADRNSNIFFIRKAGEIDKAYYTLELSLTAGNYRLTQCRGYQNCGMTEDVEEFVNKWIKEIVSKERIVA